MFDDRDTGAVAANTARFFVLATPNDRRQVRSLHSLDAASAIFIPAETMPRPAPRPRWFSAAAIRPREHHRAALPSTFTCPRFVKMKALV
jgi:hypothetical protein